MCKVVNNHPVCYGWLSSYGPRDEAGSMRKARNIDVALSGISSEVRPKSPHVSRLRPAPSPVPRVQDNVIFKGGTPHGFEAVRRWVALFGDRAAIERFVWGAWHGGLCEDHRRQVHGTVPRLWLRGDVLGFGREGRDHGAQWLGHGWSLVTGQ